MAGEDKDFHTGNANTFTADQVGVLGQTYLERKGVLARAGITYPRPGRTDYYWILSHDKVFDDQPVLWIWNGYSVTSELEDAHFEGLRKQTAEEKVKKNNESPDPEKPTEKRLECIQDIAQEALKQLAAQLKYRSYVPELVFDEEITGD